MKKIFMFLLAGALLIAACTPKTGEKSSQTSPKAQTSAPSTAPKIPLPSGNVRSNAPTAGDAPSIQIGKAETFTLDNGLKVIVVENHKLPRVSYRVFVDADPIMEKDAAGYVDMMGELLSKGTKTRTKNQIDEEVDFIGASMFSSGSGVSGSCLTKHSDKLLQIMSDVLLNPAFPAEELDKSRRQAESGLASEKDDANSIANKVGAIVRYTKGHPYGEIMNEETLAKINLDLIKNYYNTYFKPNVSYLVIVGDITKEKAEKQAKQYFGKWAKGEVPTHNYALPRPPEKTQVDFVHKPGAVQSVINITYPVELMPGTPDVVRARLMNTILGGYFNSRVNANLREGHGWTYGARSSLNQDELVGSFSGTASVRNAVTDSSITEFLREMDTLRLMKVPNEELQMVKNVMTGSFSRSLEEPGTVADFALNTARYNLPADYYEKYLANLQAVTPDEVMNMAKKYLRPDRAHIVVVGNKDDVADRLKQFSADKKINFLNDRGEPVKSSNATIPAGTTGQTIIQDYINAIGGSDKIAQLKDVSSTSVMKSRGPEFVIKTMQKGGNKLAVDFTMNGQSMSKRVYDGAKASESGMGGAMRELEGKDLEDVKEQAAFCKEAGYLKSGYQLNLKGIEDVDGKNAFVLEVVRADGKKVTEYYDMATSLKIREVTTEAGPDGQPATVTTDYSDYKEVNGVKFPHTMTLGGVFPVPMKATITELKVNAGIDDANFQMK